jgi:hypothetical protein
MSLNKTSLLILALKLTQQAEMSHQQLRRASADPNLTGLCLRWNEKHGANHPLSATASKNPPL